VVEGLEDAGLRLLPSIPSVTLYALVQGNVNPRIGRISQTYSEGDLLAWDAESGFQYLNQWSYFSPSYEDRELGEHFTVYLRTTEGGPTAQTRWTMSDGAEIRINLSSTSLIVSHTLNGVTTTLNQMGFTNSSRLPWAGVQFGETTCRVWTQAGANTRTHGINLGSLIWDRARAYGVAALAACWQPRTGWPGFSWPSLRFRGHG